MNGLILIDKPRGPSSFDVVKRVRRVSGVQQVGHTGTLDPDASGLMGVAIGKSTKLAQFLVMDEKVYSFEVVFGVETDTDDATGKVTGESGAERVSAAEIIDALPQFIGAVDQVPPDYSAVHVDGKRAYELARKGEALELASRKVDIHELDLLDFDERSKVASMRVRCGSGTYVRSIARDLGRALGTLAHARAIRRLRVGPFQIARAIPLDDLDAGRLDDGLLSPTEMVSSLPGVTFGTERARALGMGQRVTVGRSEVSIQAGFGDQLELGTPVAVVDQTSELVGIAIIENLDEVEYLLKPRRILKPATGGSGT